MQFRASADDGEIIEVIICGAEPDQIDSELQRRWPPFGLQRIDDRVGAAARTHDVSTISGWDRLESDLGLFAAERLDGIVAIHAALIVRNGRGIVIPGSSHAGKTTLSVAAISAGATVASDEFTLVDLRTGLVHGWPRPLRIRLDAGAVERRTLQDHRNDPVPVGVVAAVRYDPSGPGVTEISRADAVMAVLENCVCGSLRPADSFDAALAITTSSVHLGGTHDDATEMVAQLLAVV